MFFFRFFSLLACCVMIFTDCPPSPALQIRNDNEILLTLVISSGCVVERYRLLFIDQRASSVNTPSSVRPEVQQRRPSSKHETGKWLWRRWCCDESDNDKDGGYQEKIYNLILTFSSGREEEGHNIAFPSHLRVPLLCPPPTSVATGMYYGILISAISEGSRDLRSVV